MTPINVLVTDDSQIVRQVIIKTLSVAGVETNEVFQAGDGKEALALLEEKQIDLVISDLNMPVMSGIEMFERMQENESTRTIPVIVVTTEGSQTRIDDLKARGIKGYIRKPFTPEQIREVVDEVLAARNSGLQFEEELCSVFITVADTMAYMFAERATADELQAVGDAVESMISFSGPQSGSMVLALPKEMCLELAASVLGVERDDTDIAEKGIDAVKEMLNVICGNVLTEIAGSKPVFDLSVPTSRELDAAAWKNLASQGATVAFMVDDYPALLQLTLQ